MYIDKTYYDDEFQGDPVEDVSEFNRLAQRASEQIDQLTMYRINDIQKWPDFIQTQIKKATASIVEQYAMNGGYEAVSSSTLTNVSIGSFSYQEGADGSVNANIEKVAYKHLAPTGLLYRGVSTHG